MGGLADVAAMQGFVSNVGNVTHIADPDGAVWRRFGVASQSTYVLINDDGTIRKTGHGNLEADVVGLINS